MNWRPIRGWTKPLHERGMKAGSMPERLLIGPGSPPSIDPVYPELSPPPEPCLASGPIVARSAFMSQHWFAAERPSPSARERAPGEGKIRRNVRTAMFSRKDMLNVKRHVRLCRLWEPTVFAAMSGSVTDRSLDGCVHHASATRARRARALAWRILMKSIASTMSRYSDCSAFVSCPSLHFSASSSMCAWTSGCAQLNNSTRHLGRQALRDRVQQSVYHWRKLLCTHERNISKIPIL